MQHDYIPLCSLYGRKPLFYEGIFIIFRCKVQEVWSLIYIFFHWKFNFGSDFVNFRTSVCGLGIEF